MHAFFIKSENMTDVDCFRGDLAKIEKGSRLLEIRDELYNSLTDEQKELMDTYEDEMIEYIDEYQFSVHCILTEMGRTLAFTKTKGISKNKTDR